MRPCLVATYTSAHLALAFLFRQCLPGARPSSSRLSEAEFLLPLRLRDIGRPHHSPKGVQRRAIDVLNRSFAAQSAGKAVLSLPLENISNLARLADIASRRGGKISRLLRAGAGQRLVERGAGRQREGFQCSCLCTHTQPSRVGSHQHSSCVTCSRGQLSSILA
jgi:hypothetical protein